jgi:hypothetical protein
MRRYWYLAIAVAIAAALAVVPLTASAASAILTVGSASGPAVVRGDSLSGALSGNATFVNHSNSGQVVTCTSSSLSATAGSNPTPPGQATETNSSQTFGGCSISGVAGANGINGITTNATSACPWNVKVDDTTATATISPATASGCPTSISADVNVQTIFGAQHCVYSPTNGSIVGSVTLGAVAPLVFTTQPFTKTSGPGTCFPAADFTASYNITDTTQGGGALVVN